jgi:hypothetical protein
MEDYLLSMRDGGLSIKEHDLARAVQSDDWLANLHGI